MKKIILIVLLFLLLTGNAYAACGGSVTVDGNNYTAYDGTQECVQDAVTAAEAAGYGKTVNIPACADGDCVWTAKNAVTGPSGWYATIIVTKDMTINGAGTSSTYLTAGQGSSYSSFFTFAPDATARGRLDSDGTATFEIKGITFTKADISSEYYLMFYASGGTPIVQRIKIHDNRFINAAISLYSSGEIYGVFYSNTLTNSRGPKVEGGSVTGSAWALENAAGQMILGDGTGWYIEDNTYTCTDNYCMVASNGNRGGGWVARYNTISGTAHSGTYMFETHGNQGSGILGPQKTEIYGNLNTLTNFGLLHRPRGGKNIVMFNKHTGDVADIEIQEESSDYMTSATSPSNQCADSDSTVQTAIDYPNDGWCYSGKVHNSYFFNNRRTSNNALITTSVLTDCNAYPIANNPLEVVENREWFQDYAGGDGASGVGCGSTLPGTCTFNETSGTGPGFWVTDQSCPSMTGLVGAVDAEGERKDTTYKISGTLYKCTATDTWTAFYTPYTYPHPLRGESDTTFPTNTQAGNSINAAGTSLTLNYSETLVKTGDGTVSLTCSGGAVTPTYASGSGTANHVYTLGRTINQGEVCTVSYTQGGNDLEDTAGNDLATYADHTIVNGSTQQTETTYDFTITVVGNGTINSSQGGIQCHQGNTPCVKTCDSGTVLTLTTIPDNGWGTGTISGLNCGATTTMNAERTCTVTFPEIHLFN